MFYDIVSALFLFFVFFIWSKRGAFNIAFKLAFFAVAMWGFASVAIDSGYVVKAPDHKEAVQPQQPKKNALAF